MLKKPFHFILFSVYPVLFLYAQNITKFAFIETVSSLSTVISLSVALMWLLNRYLKQSKLSAAFTTVFVFFSFSYFNLQTYLFAGFDKLTGAGIIIAVVATLLLIFIKSVNQMNVITMALNIMAIALIIVPLQVIGLYKIHIFRNDVDEKYSEAFASPLADRFDQAVLDGRNVYYIILDGYAREDVLSDIYQFDNTKFLEGLEDKGFFVAPQSVANYGQTALSLASSLNADYIQNLLNVPPGNITDKSRLHTLIEGSRVLKVFDKLGYEVITLPTGYHHTNIQKYVHERGKWYFDQFPNAVINLTWLPEIFVDMEAYHTHHENIEYTLQRLSELVGEERQFVFAHVVVPHPPFIYEETGELSIPSTLYTRDDGYSYHEYNESLQNEYREKYVEQLQYINTRIENVIDDLIQNNLRPPIIILQSDHGPSSLLHWEDFDKTNKKERFGILNALYFPEIDYYEKVGDTPSPVNNFRHLFNAYLGTDLEILPTHVYYSTFNIPYDFREIEAP